METDEISLLKKLVVLWNGRKLILFFAFVSAITATVIAYLLPPVYKAECYFLPPNQDVNRISMLNGNMMSNTTAITAERIGGVADLAGLPETVTSGQMILGIMKRNAVLDVIIERFALMEVYKQEYKSKMREKLLKDILETTEDNKSGIITVSIEDKDPQRAADMANAFVETLQAKMLDLSLNEAVQRRVFFEEQVEKSREALNRAEAEMLAYQQESGSAIPESQMQARLQSITELQQQIVSKNSEISALLTYARQDNPKVRAARSQLATLTRELEKLQSEQRESTPQLSVEYQRYAMNLHLATTAYEVVLKQFENAKIDEAQGFFPLQVIDYATPPDYKFKPSRARVILVGTFLGLMLGMAVVVFREFRREIRKRLKPYLASKPDEPDEQYEPEEHSVRPKHEPVKRRSLLPFIFVALIICAILFLSFMSNSIRASITMKLQYMVSVIFGEEAVPLWAIDEYIVRTIAHVPMYFILVTASCISLLLYGVSINRSLMISFLLSVTIGIADEVMKMYLPGRECDIIDLVFDIAGIIFGMLAVKLLSMIFGRRA